MNDTHKYGSQIVQDDGVCSIRSTIVLYCIVLMFPCLVKFDLQALLLVVFCLLHQVPLGAL